MTVTEIADEVQAQLLSAVQIVQDTRRHHARVGRRAGRDPPPRGGDPLADRLPQATHYVDRGFDAAEQWLRVAARLRVEDRRALQPHRRRQPDRLRSEVAGDPWQQHVDALGEFIRSQRRLAKLSLRDLAERAACRTRT